jgi:penicillin-binding protein 1A
VPWFSQNALWICRQPGFQQQIERAFRTPVQMRVFTWKVSGHVMTPYDSLRYYKHFLREAHGDGSPQRTCAGIVGGINFNIFQMGWVMMQNASVGSTFKPFLYTLAMEEGLSPCQKVLNVSRRLRGDTIWIRQFRAEAYLNQE